MTQKTKSITTQNDRVFRKLTEKIGLVMILFLISFNLLSVIAAVVGVFLEYGNMEPKALYIVQEILYILAYAAGFLIPAILLRNMLKRTENYQPMMLNWRIPRITPLLILSAIALNFAIACMNSYLVTSLLPAQDFSSFMLSENVDEPYEMILLFISIAVVPAIVEEILFRGVILTNLIPYGRTTAVLGSALLFGLMHGNVLQFLYASLMGVILGYVYVRTKSIWCGILIHFFNNAISVAQEILMGSQAYDSGIRWSGIVDFFVVLGGMFAVIFLLNDYFQKKKPEDHGSFGIVFDPSLDYERYPLTKTKKLRQFFAPTMIVFVVLSGITMLMSVFMLMIGVL